jgi:hypothetical protein
MYTYKTMYLVFLCLFWVLIWLITRGKKNFDLEDEWDYEQRDND